MTQYDETRAKATIARMDTPTTVGWEAIRDRMKQSWFDCYIGRALHPQQNLAALLAKPYEMLQATQKWWDGRRAEFQIRTPDTNLNALVNFSRAISEYHRAGPGLLLSMQKWVIYSHISTGWYGKEWGGDLQGTLESAGRSPGLDQFRWHLVDPSADVGGVLADQCRPVVSRAGA